MWVPWGRVAWGRHLVLSFENQEEILRDLVPGEELHSVEVAHQVVAVPDRSINIDNTGRERRHTRLGSELLVLLDELGGLVGSGYLICSIV